MKKMRKITETMDQIVFADRNKEYGAYYLRKIYSSNMTRAIFIALFLFGISLSIPLASNIFFPKRVIIYTPDTTIFGTISHPRVKQEIDKKPVQEKKENEKFEKKIAYSNHILPSIKAAEGISLDSIMTQVKNSAVDTTDPISDRISENLKEQKEKRIEDSVWLIVEELPEFNGGAGQMIKFINDNTRFPEQAIHYGIGGTVIVSFVVKSDGKLSNVQALTHIGSGCEEEAVRVVKMMPDWTPGKQNGHPVNVLVRMPFHFIHETME